MIAPPSKNLADYAVSLQNGFLPDELPLQELPNPYYNSWEVTIGKIPQLLDSISLRTSVDKLPVLSTSYLKSEARMAASISHPFIPDARIYLGSWRTFRGRVLLQELLVHADSYQATTPMYLSSIP